MLESRQCATELNFLRERERERKAHKDTGSVCFQLDSQTVQLAITETELVLECTTIVPPRVFTRTASQREHNGIRLTKSDSCGET